MTIIDPLRVSYNQHLRPCRQIPPQILNKPKIPTLDNFGDKFGESLGGSQAPPSFWEVPGLPPKFPKLPRKFFGDFPGSSLTVELNSNPEVPRKFPKLPRKFPKLPRKFPDFPGGRPLSLGSLTPSPDSQKLSLTIGFLICSRTHSRAFARIGPGCLGQPRL